MSQAEKFIRLGGKEQIKPWQADALVDLANSQNANLLIVPPSGLGAFLNPAADSCETRLIHGFKGTGKSLLLLAKRRLLEERAKNREVLCVPRGYPYVFAPMEPALDIRFETMGLALSYSDRGAWAWLWLVLIGAYVLEAVNFDLISQASPATDKVKFRLPERLATFLFGSKADDPSMRLDDAKFVHWAKTLIQHRRVRRADLESHYLSDIQPRLKDLLNHNPIYVFLDGLDETFRDANGQLLLKVFHDRKGDLARSFRDVGSEAQGKASGGTTDSDGKTEITREQTYDLWANAQNSLVEVAQQLSNDSRGVVRLIASMRTEAFSRYHGSKGRTQLRGMIAEITYTKRQLEDIFRANIQHCDEKRLVKPRASDEIERFFGVTRVKHQRVKNAEESVFDAIVRHTLERPRDLMVIGHVLYETLDAQERSDRNRVASLVNAETETILSDYLEFMGEDWNPDIVRFTFPHIRSNVLTRSEVKRIADLVRGASKGQVVHPFCYLYERGLIGVPVLSQASVVIQEFRIRDGSPRDPDFQRLPDSTHYLIHPVLTEAIKKHRKSYGLEAFLTNSQVIVGNGKPWNFAVGGHRCEVALAPGNVPVIIIDGVNLSGEVSGRDGSQFADSEGARSSFSSFNDRATVLFFSILVALNGESGSNVTTSDVLDVISDLVERGYVKQAFRGFGQNLATAEYFKRHFEDSKGHPSLITAINRALMASDLARIKVRALEGRTVVSVEGLIGTEIAVRNVPFKDG